MNYSIITASFPIDQETFYEIYDFFSELKVLDKQPYEKLSQLSVSKDFQTKGFYILAYDEETNKLMGLVSAIDTLGLHVYEWSIVLHPMYRNIGIEEQLLNVLSQALQSRGAEGEVVVLLENDQNGKKLIEKYGYTYNYSEATFECFSESLELMHYLTIRQYDEGTDLEPLIELYRWAFGDTREESLELISFTASSEEKDLWIAEIDGILAGTLTTTKKENTLWITALAVHPPFQRQGIGTELLKWAKNFAYQCGKEKIMLEVENDNEQALSIYEKAGFKKKIQIDYYIYEG